MVPTLVDLSVRDIASTMAAWRECATVDRDPKPEPVQALYLSRTLGGRWRLDANLGPETGELLATALRLAQSPDVEGEPARSPATAYADSLGDIAGTPGSPTRLPVAAAATTSTSSSTSTATGPAHHRRCQHRRHPPRPHQHRPAALRRRRPPGPQPRPFRHLGLRHRHRTIPAPSTTPSSSATTTADSPAATAPPPGARPPHPTPGKPAAHPAGQPHTAVQPPPPPPPCTGVGRQAPPQRHARGHRPHRTSPHHHPTSRPGPTPAAPGNDDTPGAFPSARPREIRMPIAVPTLACTAGGLLGWWPAGRSVRSWPHEM